MRALTLAVMVAGCATARPAATTDPPVAAHASPAVAVPPEIPSVMCPEDTSEQRSITKAGRIAVRCERSDGVRHGPYELRRDDGELVEIGQYEDGERQGVWLTFDDDGHLADRTTYRTTAEKRAETRRRAVATQPPERARLIDGRVDFGGGAIAFTSATGTELTAGSMRLIEDAARLLRHEAAAPVRVEVRVAASASPATAASARRDRELAQRRADAVAEALGSLTADLVQAVGLGSEPALVQPATSHANDVVELRLAIRRSARND